MQHETEAAKKKRLAERKRVNDFMAARGRGGAYSGMRSTTPSKPTAAQARNKGAETFRKKYTPSGLQGLVDVLTEKKKER